MMETDTFRSFGLVVCLILSALVSLTSSANTQVLGCGTDSIGNNGWCYYINVRDNITWSQAQRECATRDGKLLRIETAAELNFITNTLTKYDPTVGIWTGLNDWNADYSAGTGNWLWDDEEYSNKSLIKWNTEPDNDDNQDCCAINIQAKFSDEQCSRRLGFICELDRTSTVGCPFGWMPTDTTCYYISDPKDYSQILTWDQANKNCSSWAPISAYPTVFAHLVTLNNAYDSEYMSSQMPELTATSFQWWTGLNDKAHEQEYVWVTQEPYIPSYISWVHEPDNVGNKENCGLFLMNGEFSDRNCNEGHGYACRKDVSMETSLSNMGCDTWIRGGNKCYSFYDGPKGSWAAGNTNCKGALGRLLQIESQDEALFMDLMMTQVAHKAGHYWMGLKRQQHLSKTFVWSDGSPANNSYLNWNTAPDNYGGLACATFTRYGAWQDDTCSADWNAYICEMTIPSGTCPSGWVQRPGTMSCYYFSNGKSHLRWAEARDECNRKSKSGASYLFCMTDKNEKAWITKYVMSLGENSPGTYWTGMNDVALTGRWMYNQPMPQAANMALVVWDKEPNNWGQNEDCVEMKTGGRLNDLNCKAKIGFICERPVTKGVGIFSPGKITQTTGTAADIHSSSLLALGLALVVKILTTL